MKLQRIRHIWHNVFIQLFWMSLAALILSLAIFAVFDTHGSFFTPAVVVWLIQLGVGVIMLPFVVISHLKKRRIKDNGDEYIAKVIAIGKKHDGKVVPDFPYKKGHIECIYTNKRGEKKTVIGGKYVFLTHESEDSLHVTVWVDELDDDTYVLDVFSNKQKRKQNKKENSTNANN